MSKKQAERAKFMDDYREQYNTYDPHHHAAHPPPHAETAVVATEPGGLAVIGGFAKDYWPILFIILIGIGLFFWLNKREDGIKSLLSGRLKPSGETL